MTDAFERVLTLEQVDRVYGGVADPADAALATKPPAGATPGEVNTWWDGLTREQQLAIIAAGPGAIGNLDGIPAQARDDANTVALDRDLADWGLLEHRGLLTDDERQWLDNARAADRAIETIEGRVDPVTGEPIESQLYIYDPAAFDGDGRVAVSAGNLDTADNVAVVVPGFGTDAQSAPYHADRARDDLRVDPLPRRHPDQRHHVLDRLRRPRQPALDRRGLGRRRRAHRGRGHRGRRSALRHDRRAARQPRRRPCTPDDDRPQLRLDHDRSRCARRRPRDRRHHLRRQPGRRWRHRPRERHRPGPRPRLGRGQQPRSDHLPRPTTAGCTARPCSAPDSATTRRRTTSVRSGSRPSRSRAVTTAACEQHSLYFDHGTESLHNLSQIVNGNYDGVDRRRAQLRPVVGRRAGSRARPRPDHAGDALRSWVLALLLISAVAACDDPGDDVDDPAGPSARLEAQRADVRALVATLAADASTVLTGRVRTATGHWEGCALGVPGGAPQLPLSGLGPHRRRAQRCAAVPRRARAGTRGGRAERRDAGRAPGWPDARGRCRASWRCGSPSCRGRATTCCSTPPGPASTCPRTNAQEWEGRPDPAPIVE